jgi:predicted DsbA family dithiol-disulfide isomerase
LKKFAADLGLDTAAFNQCLDSQKYAQIVESDTQTAQQIGVRSTPSFVVNGTPLVGAQPIEEFQRLIEQFSK